MPPEQRRSTARTSCSKVGAAVSHVDAKSSAMDEPQTETLQRSHVTCGSFENSCAVAGWITASYITHTQSEKEGRERHLPFGLRLVDTVQIA